jgi:hypothetical protein
LPSTWMDGDPPILFLPGGEGNSGPATRRKHFPHHD